MLRRVRDSNTPEVNKSHALKFFDYLRANGLSKARRLKSNRGYVYYHLNEDHEQIKKIMKV